MSEKLAKCINCSTLDTWKSVISGGSIVKYLKVSNDTIISVPTAVNYIFRLPPDQKLVNKDGAFFGCCSACAIVISKLYKLHKKLEELNSIGSVIQEIISTEYQTTNTKVFQFVNTDANGKKIPLRAVAPPAIKTDSDMDLDFDEMSSPSESEAKPILNFEDSLEQPPSADPNTVMETQETKSRPKRKLTLEERRAKIKVKNKKMWDKRPIITHGPCEYCGKVFYNKKPNWMELHTNMMHKHVTKFICRICAKPCQNNKNLLKHERCHMNAEERHQLALEEGIQTAFLCYECGKVLSSEVSLKNHAQCHEPRELRQITCEEPGCTVTVTGIKSLRRHHRRKHQ